MEKSMDSSQKIRSIKPRRKSDVGKKQNISLEFMNYKPLNTLDLPIESEDIDDDKHYSHSDNCVIENTYVTMPKLKVNHPYIDYLLKKCLAIKLETIKIDTTTLINITFHKRLQLFIDLDDTIIYTSKIRINKDDTELDNGLYICVRPFTNLFLSKLSINFDIIVIYLNQVYSSAGRSYVANILKLVDPYEYISSILSFENCINYKSMVLKPLQRVEGLIKGKYVFIDDNIANVLVNKGHSILISPYKGNFQDIELLKILNYLLDQCKFGDITKSIDSLY